MYLKIGIWGFGVVGLSIFKYLVRKQDIDLLIYDNQDLTQNILFKNYQIKIANDLINFLEECDFVYPSPGIDLSDYQKYQAKFLSELDLFYQNWHKSIIAITGTLGKTTLTTLLASILNQSQQIKTIAAGNVGLGMCDILDTDYEQVVLELSSFQLEQANNFAPDLAILTNFYPNHLDRHKTLNAYIQAKAKIFLQQDSSQVTLLPINLLDALIRADIEIERVKSQIYLFGDAQELKSLNLIPESLKAKITGVFAKQAEDIILIDLSQPQTSAKRIADLQTFKQIDTYVINLVILAAVCYLRQVVLPVNFVFEPIAHRVEKFYTSANQIDFYNDSKSTVAQATLAAVNKLKLASRPIILFLGGMSKGVDRAELIQNLSSQVKLIICFGAEADQLFALCQKYHINSAQFNNLELALDCCLSMASPGDQVLFSPSGASFDLFKDYVQRGEVFKKLVQQKFLENV